MSTTDPLAGFALVMRHPQRDVYCNGKQRVWVNYSRPRDPAPTMTQPCPACTCSAFQAGKP